MTTAPETLTSKVTRYQALRETLDELRREAGMLEQEIVAEMEAMDATLLPHPDYKVSIPTARQYDTAKVAALAEVIEPEHFERLYVPAHEELRQVPATVNGRVALELMKAGYKRELESCLLPAARKLKVEPKGEKS